MPVKVMADECYGTYSQMAEGIVYAADAGADIILIASGGYAPRTAWRQRWRVCAGARCAGSGRGGQ